MYLMNREHHEATPFLVSTKWLGQEQSTSVRLATSKA